MPCNIFLWKTDVVNRHRFFFVKIVAMGKTGLKNIQKRTKTKLSRQKTCS